jgi:hypothetical protein
MTVGTTAKARLMTGEPLNLSLELLEGGEPRGISGERQADALARFEKLADDN